MKDKYLDKWSDDFGFWSPDGCTLGEDRPQECKDYHCKEYAFFSSKAFIDGAWRTIGLHEIKLIDRDRTFIDKYNDVFRKLT